MLERTATVGVMVCTGAMILSAGLAGGSAGCRAVQEGFDAPSPTKRLDAIVAANAAGDETAIRDLIRQLDSTDPAARMLSIRTLESWTGETMGYDHAAPDYEREPAIQRWVDWYNAQAGETQQMASAAGSVDEKTGTDATPPASGGTAP